MLSGAALLNQMLRADVSISWTWAKQRQLRRHCRGLEQFPRDAVGAAITAEGGVVVEAAWAARRRNGRSVRISLEGVICNPARREDPLMRCWV